MLQLFFWLWSGRGDDQDRGLGVLHLQPAAVSKVQVTSMVFSSQIIRSLEEDSWLISLSIIHISSGWSWLCCLSSTWFTQVSVLEDGSWATSEQILDSCVTQLLNKWQFSYPQNCFSPTQLKNFLARVQSTEPSCSIEVINLSWCSKHSRNFVLLSLLNC